MCPKRAKNNQLLNMVYFWVAGWSTLNLTLHGKGKAYSALGITANPLFRVSQLQRATPLVNIQNVLLARSQSHPKNLPLWGGGGRKMAASETLSDF